MSRLRRQPREKVDLFYMTAMEGTLDALTQAQREGVAEAITHAQEQLNLPTWRRRGFREVALYERKHPMYAIEYGRYTVIVLNYDGKHVVSQVLHLESRPLFPPATEPQPDIDPDDRCGSCQRWSGHPHASWCSTRCTCPDDAKRHLPGCGELTCVRCGHTGPEVEERPSHRPLCYGKPCYPKDD